MKATKIILPILLCTGALLAGIGFWHGTKYAGDSLFETEQYATSEVVYLTETAQDSLNIEIHFEYPTALKNRDALTIIQSQILHELFGEAFREMHPQHAMDAYVAMLKTEYKLDNQSLAELSECLSQEHYLDGRTMGFDKGIISYGIERYMYLGGPHGSNYRKFINFLTADAAPFTEADLFQEGFEAPISKMIIAKIIEQNEGFTSEDDLREAGYWVEQIAPNGNFYLAEEGVTYVFNPMEIAPYSHGEVEVLLSWDEVEPFLIER